LPLNLKKKGTEFVVELCLLLGVPILNAGFIPHKNLDKHVVIVVIIFRH